MSGQQVLPGGVDPLREAFFGLHHSEWSIDRLVDEAHRIALAGDDYSLTGLAAWIRDPVVLAALGESVVLYMQIGSARRLEEPPPPPKFVWAVDQELVERANRFVSSFNAFSSHPLEEIPTGSVSSDIAQLYYFKFSLAEIAGRCVRLADGPKGFYHWAIYKDSTESPAVEEFWSEEIWTTRMYKDKLGL